MVKNSSPLKNFIGALTGADQLRIEKNRLEAFLAGCPGEYCGFSRNGDVLFSENFIRFLNLETIKTIEDIQSALETEQADILSSLFKALVSKGTPFEYEVYVPSNKKHLSLKGTCGYALDESDAFYILWLNDITDSKKEFLQLEQQSVKKHDESAQLKFILDAMAQVFWLRDEAGEIIWRNKAYVNFVKEKTDEIIIKPRDKSDIKTIKDLSQKALSEKMPQTFHGHVVSNGKRLFVKVTESPLLNKNQTLGSMQDLTEEEEASATYNRHLTANQSLLEHLRTAVAIYNADQKLEFFNSAFSELWGLEDQWLNNQPKLGDVLEKLRDTRRLPEQADFRSYKQGWLDMFTRLIDPLDDMLYLPDDTALRMLVIPHPVGGLMMTFEDVTSRLELESSYNTLIAVQKETLDNLAEGVAVFGSDGRIQLFNPSYAKLWRLNPENLEGNPHISRLAVRMIQLFDEENSEDVKDKLIAHGIERRIQEGRLRLKNKQLLEFTTVPLPDGGVMVTYFDVTDSVKVENALREKNAALETAERLKTDFLANVSYQLRTPLNAIIGFAEILDNQYFGDLNDKQKEYSVGIQDAGSKLVRLIDDILDLSTIEAGYLDLNYDEVEVQTILDDLLILTKEWALKQQIQVKLDYDSNIANFMADERRIKQVLLNLIRNAINFTPDSGHIILKAYSDEENIIFSVSDTGIGISKTDMERIFEPFERAIHEQRADMSQHALSRGAGLGLSLVKNIITLHGGSVDIDSIEGEGTTVTVNIPTKPLITA